ncbi:MAG: sugar phosphate isomerase/epimerase [Balneolaceae bacterium]|nr:MAG: sugar phosphate isomerase/epimerase [Balneolaceae bacterium]
MIKETNQRRTFLKQLAAGVAAGTLIPVTALAGRKQRRIASSGTASARTPFHVKLGISSYSYWHFSPERTPIRHVIEEASRLGVYGVDILHRQMESENPEYIRSLKRHALMHGVALNCLSTHQDFVNPDPAERQKSIDDTKRFVRLAYQLGIPCIRISAGRWGTTDTFAELMANRGLEPAIEGYTEDDAYGWCIDAINEVVPVAEEHGVMLGLENHWGMTRSAEGVLRILNAVDSPWLKVLMDTGNFLEETYEQLEMLAPHTVFIQAKTYYGGGRFYTLDLDYERIGRILKAVDYKGYVSIEFEGFAPSAEAVAESIDLLRDALT